MYFKVSNVPTNTDTCRCILFNTLALSLYHGNINEGILNSQIQSYTSVAAMGTISLIHVTGLGKSGDGSIEIFNTHTESITTTTTT